MKRSEAESVLLGIISGLHEDNEEEKAVLARVSGALSSIKQAYKADQEMDKDFPALVSHYEKQATEAAKRAAEARAAEANRDDERKANAWAMFEGVQKASQSANPEPVRTSSTAAILSKTTTKEERQKEATVNPLLKMFQEIINDMVAAQSPKELERLHTEFSRNIESVKNVAILESVRDYFYESLMSDARQKLKSGAENASGYEAEKKKYLKDGGNAAFTSLQEKIKRQNGRVIEYQPEKTGLERKESSDALKVIMPKESRNPFRRHR